MAEETRANDTQTPVRQTVNPYDRFLLWGGVTLLVLGAFVALMFRRAVDHAMLTAEFTYAQGGAYDPSAAQAAVGGYWVGIAVAVVGGILLLAAIITRAMRR